MAVVLAAYEEEGRGAARGGTRPADRHGDEAAELGGLVAYVGAEPVLRWRHGPRGSGDEAERRTRRGIAAPDRCVTGGGLSKRVEDLAQVAHARVSVSRTTLPAVWPGGVSERLTSSISLRMMNNPRPSSRSKFSLRVAAPVFASR